MILKRLKIICTLDPIDLVKTAMDIYTDVKYKPGDVGEHVPGKKKPEEPKETPKNLDKPQQNPQDLNIK